MLVTDDPIVAELAICLRAHGWARDLPVGSLLRPLNIASHAFKAAYDFLVPGYNLRPLEMQAVLGLSQLPRLAAMQELRVKNAAYFRETMSDCPYLQQGIRGKPVPYGFVLIAQFVEHRARTLMALDAVGIEYRMVTGGCFTQHPAAAHYLYTTHGTLPNAKRIHDCGFFIGNHAVDLSREIDLLHKTLKGIKP